MTPDEQPNALADFEQTLRERVARGARLLDDRGPAGWRDRVDLARLDLADTEHCVIGQVYGPAFERVKDLIRHEPGVAAMNPMTTYTAYGFGLALLDVPCDEASMIQDIEHGFAPDTEDGAMIDQDGARLTAAWRAYLTGEADDDGTI